MKKLGNLLRKAVLLLAGVMFSISAVAQPQGLGLERAAAVKAARVGQLLATPGVVGAGVGLDGAGRGAIHILVIDNAAAAKMPNVMDDVAVVTQVTGEILALRGLEPVAAERPAGTKPTRDRIDPSGYFNRPVPIGVSTGNAQVGTPCSAGTIGCRVIKGNAVYALSNNHVYARENDAAIGEPVSQPGPYDTRCIVSSKYDLGSLADFVEINFSGANHVDAAIALTTTDLLGNATPANGYGVPKAATTEAVLGDAVQKYGRTTALTKGAISAVDVMINVGYSKGTATFANQILVFSRRAFIKAGDSGSLLVTDPGKNPVGLLFAGNSTGQYAFANPIGAVIKGLGVTIDGE
ncbi:MAG TPA: hypothetical protein VJA21_31105 [Verrucomicrobiae bacterium]